MPMSSWWSIRGCAASLATFIDSLDAPYLTARGFDVIQLPDEKPLPHPPPGPILRDRGFAYPNTALNKTCIVRTQVAWSAGFHWASVHPRLGPLFMLHMKRLDIGWQVGWFGRMLDNIRDNPKVDPMFKEYYAPDEVKDQGLPRRHQPASAPARNSNRGTGWSSPDSF